MAYSIWLTAKIQRPFAICHQPYAIWSGKRDSNPRPRAWKARALPTELFPPTQPKKNTGGEGRIRTSEGISRQIYSLLPLATREPLRSENFPDSSADGRTGTRSTY